MNQTSNILMIVMVPTILALLATAFAGPLSGVAVAQIVTGTPGEVGTTNESEDYYPPVNETGPETIQTLEGITGSDQALMGNDTNISNPNITASDAGKVNSQEECMRLNNQSAVACP